MADETMTAPPLTFEKGYRGGMSFRIHEPGATYSREDVKKNRLDAANEILEANKGASR